MGRNNKLNGDLYWFHFRLYCYTSAYRRGQRTLHHGGPPFQKSIEVKEILWIVYSSSSSTSHRLGISSSLTTFLTCCPGFLFGKEGHYLLRCPAFQQQKHSPFLIQRFLSSRMSFPMQITSTSIALGSLAFEEWGVSGWYRCWVGCWFLLKISSAYSHWVWKWIALKYHSWMVVGIVSMDMIHHMREGGIPAEKYPMRTLESLILAWETWFWNSETYWFRGGEYVRSFLQTICLVVSQAIAAPVMSLYLISSLNLVIKFEYVPRIMVPVASMEFSWKVAAQVRADPLVI